MIYSGTVNKQEDIFCQTEFPPITTSLNDVLVSAGNTI